jgi:nucleoid-associated protein YgaU
MTTYHFPAEAGAAIVPGGAPDPSAIAAHLDRLGLPHGGVRITRRGEAGARLEGSVPDPPTRERLLLAIGNLRGIARVEDRLTVAAAPRGLLDGLAAFGRLPAGAANLAGVRDALRHAEPEPDTVFGPGGSLLHTVQPGETLAAIAARHYGATPGAEERILEANLPVLPGPAAVLPGIVLRLPER